MAVFPIRLFPDSILRRPAKAVSWPDPNLARFLKDLIGTLYAQPGGVGIAAPQVGEGIRVIVIDVSRRDPLKRMEVMINPVLRHQQGKVVSREGCMSLPDYTANVLRFEQVVVEWIDPEGHRRRMRTRGLEAVCLQHEIDHLNGVLFVDRVGSLKTDVFPRARKQTQ